MEDQIELQPAEPKKRNPYIDALRGIAALSIVAIHTAFWSGTLYTPEWFWNITLFVDVPFFFYLSGWASSYRKADIIKSGKSLLNIWVKWIFFVTVFAVICFILTKFHIRAQGAANFRSLVSSYMYHVDFKGFPVFCESLWFMPYYYAVILVNTVVLMGIQLFKNYKQLEKCYMWITLFVFLWAQYENFVFGLDILTFVFYTFFWMLGYNLKGSADRLWKFIAALVLCAVGAAVASYLQNIPLHDIQNAKFPPSAKYLCVSLIIIFICKYIEPRVKRESRILTHIGRNALFYYFAQGIASSLCYYIYPHVNAGQWFLKWLIVFCCNIAMTAAMAEGAAAAYKCAEKAVLKIINKFIQIKAA